MTLPFAHALASRQDLPIPEWLFTWGASLVLIVSFFLLASSWRTPRFESDDWRPFSDGFSRVLLSLPVQILCGALAVFLLGVTVYSGLEGTPAPDRNFAVTFVFVTVWLGFVVLSVFLGDIFKAFNPWRAIGRAFGALFKAISGQEPAHFPYPERLGRWPAAIGVVVFVWFEVVWGTISLNAVGVTPDDIAVAALIYSTYTLLMMALFGTEKWSERGEFFSVYFNMFSQLGVFEARDQRLGRRRLFSATTRWAAVPGSLALVVASIGTTSYDGAQEGVLGGPLEDVYEFILDSGVSLTWSARLSQTIFLLLCIAAVAGVYLLGVKGMQSVRGAPGFEKLRAGFAHTLIPIAFAYLLAHYFSLLVFQEQAQFTYLLSDPLNDGSNIFGTASSGVDYTVISANLIWYVQVGALIVGHVIGLVLAHDRAVALWGNYKQAARSQYWMLAVMVAFTCFGLFLLSVANE